MPAVKLMVRSFFYFIFYYLMCFKVMFFSPDVINVNFQKKEELEGALKQHGLTFPILLMSV